MHHVLFQNNSEVKLFVYKELFNNLGDDLFFIVKFQILEDQCFQEYVLNEPQWKNMGVGSAKMYTNENVYLF